MSRRVVVVVLLVGVLAALTCGCDETTISPTDMANKEQAGIASAQSRLVAAQPAPVLSRSQERAQVILRAERFAEAEKLGYVYLISYGRVMAMYPVKGKVSSLNSYLTAQDTAQKWNGGMVAVSAPDIDGTYGANVEGIFFFTPEDVYVEWNGDYMYCDAPLKMSTQPDIVYVAPLK